MGLAVADLFQHATSRNQSLDISCHSPNRASIISASADQRSLILALHNHQTCSSPHTNQDGPSPTNHAQKTQTGNTAFDFENVHQSTPVHTHAPNQSTHPALSQPTPFETRPEQLSNRLVTSQDRASITPPLSVSLNLYSSISPNVKANPLHEEQSLCSAPGSSFSRSPQTDSSISSRHTEHSDHVTSSSADGVKPCAANHDLSAAHIGPHGLFGSRGRAHKNFELSFCPKSDSSDNFNMASSIQTPNFQTFKDFSSVENSQATLSLIPKLASSTNSSPTELCHKVIFSDGPRASTNPSSPHLSNHKSSAPSAGALAPAWSHHHSLSYPGTSDDYNHRQSCHVFYSTPGGMPSFSVADHNNPTMMPTSTDANKSTDPNPFSVNKSSTSPSTTAWTTDELNENQSSTIGGNISVNDTHPLFSFPPPHPPTQAQAYGNSGSLEHSYKFVDRNPSHSNSLGLLPAYNPQRAPYMEKIPENLVVLGEAGSTGLNKLAHRPSEETGHNAVEKRYRNNINSHIAALADLVPALQHLRSLPSAATSRRHSSQFIVSTSAIGKIPTGLVDGVKAATKLSKGNILSKSVDYMRHLLRRRAELEEDIEDLKEVVKSRVEKGEILILQWEEIVNSKLPDRQRLRMLEQNQGEEDGDDDDDMNDSNNKRTGLSVNHSLNPNKKRKVSDAKIGDTGKPKSGKITALKTPRKATEFLNQSVSSIKCEALYRSSEPLPPGANHGSFVHNAASGRHEPLNTHELVDELDVLREPPTNYHHQFLAHHHNTHDFNHSHTSEFSPDFMGHPFAPVQPPEPYSQQAINASSRPLLAVFMGLSLAVGSGYSYHQTWRTSYASTEAWKSPDNSRSAEGCPLSTVPSSSLQGFNCNHGAKPDHSHCLLNSNPTSGTHHSSVTQAGLNTMSIAIIIWTLILIFKPEFILNYCSSDRLKRSKEKTKFRGQMIFENFRNDSNESCTDHEGGSRETLLYEDYSYLPIQNSLLRGDDDEQIFVGCSQKPGKIQYDRLCDLTSCPNNWRSIFFDLSKEITRTTVHWICGETFRRIVGIDGKKRESKKSRMKQIKMVLAWVRIVEIESSSGFGRTSALKRLHSILKLYNLYGDLNWADRVTKEELEPGKILAILALSLKNLFGEANRVSPILWRRATEAHQSDQISFKSVKTSTSILPACYYRPSFQRVTEESWLNESLMLGYEEVCELLAGKGEQYRLMSADAGEFGGNRGWSPLKQIVETRAELELIEIWSRIFVSMITKTCPVEKTSKDVRITERHFGLDGGLAELPTRLEEAGAPYALQVSQGRRKVEQSIERICRLRLGSSSAVGRMARVTRGMWAMAFGKREIAVKVGEELKREGKEDDEILCVGPFLELVLGSRLLNKPRDQKVNSTLDKLAKMTIDWLLIRREHIMLNVIETSSNRIASETYENKKRLAMKCKGLKSTLRMGLIESERNRELNARSTKQTDEAIQAGEARELDLRTAIEECQRSVIAIENENQKNVTNA